ncbi:cation transporter [Anaeromyxobacter sp. PSR-1]|uniref:cation transporter n=1 Tax=unclassified Anaeromyxobacter TaxID=2620896 RepID=UPI0005DE02B5|nr:cation transporter [Anaeromyxobacter sp. PSR-1]GAO04378.1 zinc homeostasis factor 1 [Anaeromyxobacter sp. PSR-1]
MPTPGTTRTVFAVPRMDCPSEERMIRLALDGAAGIDELRFDLQARTLTVLHAGDPAPLLARLRPLGLGARLASSAASSAASPAAHGAEVPGAAVAAPDPGAEARTLRLLLAVNAAMFLVEGVVGWLAESTGLIADSLDMLADALVYGLSLWAVGRAARAQLRAAHVSGVLQAALALGVFADVARRLLAGSAPEPPAMIGVSALALAANVGCLVLVARHRHGGAHMKASWIFSTNDVLANLGVIAAGALVAWTGSALPDLVIGTAVALLVLAGAVRILRLR